MYKNQFNLFWLKNQVLYLRNNKKYQKINNLMKVIKLTIITIEKT